MVDICIQKLKKREIITELENKVNISRQSLLKLSKKELLGLLREKLEQATDGTEKKEPSPKKKKKKPKKKRLLDFSSDEEDEPEPQHEPQPEPQPEQEQEEPQPKPEEKTKIVEIKEPEKEPVKEVIEPKQDTTPMKKSKKMMKEIKLEIKTLMKEFADKLSQGIAEYKKTEIDEELIDCHNELRSDYESEVRFILDENNSKVTHALLDYVDNLFTTQYNRVDRLLN